MINVISFPKAPISWITIENKHGSQLKINCSKVVPAVFPYNIHGKVPDINGYQMTFVIDSVTNKWLNEFTVYVENHFGKRGFKVALKERSPTFNTFGIISFFKNLK